MVSLAEFIFMWYNQHVQQIFGHSRTQLVWWCLGKYLSYQLHCYIVVTPGFPRDYDSGIQFIESLYVSDKRCHLSFPYFSLLERTWERERVKNKDNDKEGDLALHGSFSLFFTLPEPFCVFHLLLLPHPREKRPRNKIFCHQTCATGDLSDIVFWAT